ncbi:MAG: sodium:solute symporter [Chitinophagaceae bacterium]|nr:sodium:solute symporter [Chitinophagaceae bacterium]
MQTADYLIVLFYLVLVTTIGITFRKKSSKNLSAYFLGNRKLPWWLLGISGMVSNTDVTGTMINIAMVYAFGTMGFFIEIRGGVVLILAFLLVFMGKWNRRSKVMTVPEWMFFRFGKNKQGEMARLVSAVSTLVLAVVMVSYFIIGIGKFAGMLLHVNPRMVSFIIIIIVTGYTIIGGFFGVVWTNFFQGFIIFTAIFYLGFIAFYQVDIPKEIITSIPLEKGTQVTTIPYNTWTQLLPSFNAPVPGKFSMYASFGWLLLFYLFRTSLDGFGGPRGYVAQRFFAAKNDREAGLLTLLWMFLLSFRWFLIAAVALLGIYYNASHFVIEDPELVLPQVISHYLPVGLKGLVVAALLGAAVATFDSYVNAQASIWVKDIYQLYCKPKASGQQLIKQARLATALLVVAGLSVSLTVSNIIDIWGWITIGLGGGIFIPNVLRWYWWRLNGYGFSIGIFSGLVAALVAKWALKDLPEYYVFFLSSGFSLAGCIAGAYLTSATPVKVLANFYTVTRPFGFWNIVKKDLTIENRKSIVKENNKDLLSLLLALPFQLSLFLLGMMVAFRRWDNVLVLSIILIGLFIGLYFIWYRRLEKEKKP